MTPGLAQGCQGLTGRRLKFTSMSGCGSTHIRPFDCKAGIAAVVVSVGMALTSDRPGSGLTSRASVDRGSRPEEELVGDWLPISMQSTLHSGAGSDLTSRDKLPVTVNVTSLHRGSVHLMDALWRATLLAMFLRPNITASYADTYVKLGSGLSSCCGRRGDDKPVGAGGKACYPKRTSLLPIRWCHDAGRSHSRPT